MADKIFLTLILISVLLGCNGNGNLRADQSISGGISSPELSVGEALVYIGNGAKQCENDGMLAGAFYINFEQQDCTNDEQERDRENGVSGIICPDADPADKNGPEYCGRLATHIV